MRLLDARWRGLPRGGVLHVDVGHGGKQAGGRWGKGCRRRAGERGAVAGRAVVCVGELWFRHLPSVAVMHCAALALCGCRG